MKVIKTTPISCGSEREFLGLKGDASELLKVTFGDSRDHNQLNGWWLYERINGKNVFLIQHPDQENYPLMVNKFFCETRYLQFDRNLGICPDLYHYNYCPLGEVHSEERDKQIIRLKERKLWKN